MPCRDRLASGTAVPTRSGALRHRAREERAPRSCPFPSRSVGWCGLTSKIQRQRRRLFLKLMVLCGIPSGSKVKSRGVRRVIEESWPGPMARLARGPEAEKSQHRRKRPRPLPGMSRYVRVTIPKLRRGLTALLELRPLAHVRELRRISSRGLRSPHGRGRQAPSTPVHVRPTT